MNNTRIYVASSWRCAKYPKVVEELKTTGADIYDFRNPEPGNNGFSWSSIDPNWKNWDREDYMKALKHPLAESGYNFDISALHNAHITILVLPCGRSAHLELGIAAGRGQKTAILLDETFESELMYKAVDLITYDIAELKDFIINYKK